MAPNSTCTGKECFNQGVNPVFGVAESPWHETEALAGFRIWHIIFLSIAGFLSLVIFICCCVRIRIPRTKQEIEADYIRRKITRKFEKQLRLIHNADMDEMDLKRALERIRADFKSDTESLAHSEALSGATISSGNFNGATNEDSSFAHRKSSDIGVTFESLLEKQRGGNRRKFPGVANLLAKCRPPGKASLATS